MKLLSVGRYFGIPVFIHWTFSFMILFVTYVAILEGLTMKQVIAFSLYLACMFLCVVLNEYGHALMARRFGISTHDILITPIGGLARLEGLPFDPKGELYIALAGPVVNLVIAALLFSGFYLSGIGFLWPDLEEIDLMELITNPIGFVHMLLIVNIVLFVFNLVPAFPMDGGRVVRALLSYKMTRERATFYAAILGKILSIGFLVFATYNKMPSLFFISIFIFVMAGREYRMVKKIDRDY